MATEGTGAIAARELGQGWKISPSSDLAGNETPVLADLAGHGAIQHIWLTIHSEPWRRLVLRCFWGGKETPSIETPLGDFFCSGWGVRCNVASLPIAVNPAGGFNSCREMPFRRHARITVENIGLDPVRGFYYQITYALTVVSADRAYLHAQFRRSKPLPERTVHTLRRHVVPHRATVTPWRGDAPHGYPGRAAPRQSCCRPSGRFASAHGDGRGGGEGRPLHPVSRRGAD